LCYPEKNLPQLISQISANKKRYREEWTKHKCEKLNPVKFFDSLRKQLSRESILVVDDGNHTYLTAELMPIEQPSSFISPTDFNCMGYSIPAAIGAKINNPDKPVVAILGDGCFRMTCMEIVTAIQHQLGIVFFVFNDGELSQISQAQEIPYNRKPCTELAPINYEAISTGLGAKFYKLTTKDDIDNIIKQALSNAVNNQSVIVDVEIDYSKKTAFTQGAVKTNFGRFDSGTKLRFLARSIKRKITG